MRNFIKSSNSKNLARANMTAVILYVKAGSHSINFELGENKFFEWNYDSKKERDQDLERIDEICCLNDVKDEEFSGKIWTVSKGASCL